MQQVSMQLQECFCVRAKMKLPKTSARLVKVRPVRESHHYGTGSKENLKDHSLFKATSQSLRVQSVGCKPSTYTCRTSVV